MFSILPPYNTIHAQVVDAYGQPGDRPEPALTVTYEAVADPDGSINTTSVGKTNFWEHVQALFGVTLPRRPGPGRASRMPGRGNHAASR